MLVIYLDVLVYLAMEKYNMEYYLARQSFLLTRQTLNGNSTLRKKQVGGENKIGKGGERSVMSIMSQRI